MDDDAHEQPDDLLTLLVGQSGVQAGPNLGQEVMRLLGDHLGTWSLCGGHAGFQPGPLTRDPVEFGIKLVIWQTATDVEGDSRLALAVEGIESVGERDRLGFRDRALGFALSGGIEVIENIAGGPEEPLHVGPDKRLDLIGPDRTARTTAGDDTPFDELAAAAIPAGVAAPGADVGEAADATLDHTLEQVDPVRVLGATTVAGEGSLSLVP